MQGSNARICRESSSRSTVNCEDDEARRRSSSLGQSSEKQSSANQSNVSQSGTRQANGMQGGNKMQGGNVWMCRESSSCSTVNCGDDEALSRSSSVGQELPNSSQSILSKTAAIFSGPTDEADSSQFETKSEKAAATSGEEDSSQFHYKSEKAPDSTGKEDSSQFHTKSEKAAPTSGKEDSSLFHFKSEKAPDSTGKEDSSQFHYKSEKSPAMTGKEDSSAHPPSSLGQELLDLLASFLPNIWQRKAVAAEKPAAKQKAGQVLDDITLSTSSASVNDVDTAVSAEKTSVMQKPDQAVDNTTRPTSSATANDVDTAEDEEVSAENSSVMQKTDLTVDDTTLSTSSASVNNVDAVADKAVPENVMQKAGQVLDDITLRTARGSVNDLNAVADKAVSEKAGQLLDDITLSTSSATVNNVDAVADKAGDLSPSSRDSTVKVAELSTRFVEDGKDAPAVTSPTTEGQWETSNTAPTTDQSTTRADVSSKAPFSSAPTTDQSTARADVSSQSESANPTTNQSTARADVSSKSESANPTTDQSTARADVNSKSESANPMMDQLRSFQQKVAAGLKSAKFVAAIHNFGFQGLFQADSFPKLGLPVKHLPFLLTKPKEMDAKLDGELSEIEGQPEIISWLQAAVLLSDLTLTVSPSYAREIIATATQALALAVEDGSPGEDGGSFSVQGGTENQAEPLPSVPLAQALTNKGVLGLLNGIDDLLWNPATDEYLPEAMRYGVEGVARGKAQGRALLQHRLGLDINPDGADVLLSSLPVLLGPPKMRVSNRQTSASWTPPAQDNDKDRNNNEVDAGSQPRLQLVALGTGAPWAEEALAELSTAYPGTAVGLPCWSEPLAHLMMAACDYLLVPSRYEPCGIVALCAVRYGTIPIVAPVGGLVDIVNLNEPYRNLLCPINPSTGDESPEGGLHDSRSGVGATAPAYYVSGLGYRLAAPVGAVGNSLALRVSAGRLADTMRDVASSHGSADQVAMRDRCMKQDVSWDSLAEQWERVLMDLM
eukprot:gene23236-30460_t